MLRNITVQYLTLFSVSKYRFFEYLFYIINKDSITQKCVILP